MLKSNPNGTGVKSRSIIKYLMKPDSAQKKLVSLEGLKREMFILAYVGFSKKYRPMDEATCKWVKLNFKGANTLVERGGEKLELTTDQLNAGDRLFRLYRFPVSLKKLIIVNENLINELKDRGFNKFYVRQNRRPQSSKQALKRKAVRMATEMVHKVKESVEMRQGAVKALENMMDNAKKGKIRLAEIRHHIDTIADTSSAEAMGVIAALKKSDQTYAHCIDVAAIFQVVYKKIYGGNRDHNVFKDEKQMILASFLHDVGKAKLPSSILDCTEKFENDSREKLLIRKHPLYGAEMLSKMGMPGFMVNMAKYHHVKLDTSMYSSYPEDARYESASKETRLIAIIDIYQALVGRRSYKKSWAPPAAMRYIEQLAGIEYDFEISEYFQHMMGHFPKGSLVELSDGSQAFAISVPKTDLERPQVIIVRNAKGQYLENHTFLDLAVEKDLSISKGLDHYDIFGEASLEFFMNLQVS